MVSAALVTPVKSMSPQMQIVAVNTNLLVGSKQRHQVYTSLAHSNTVKRFSPGALPTIRDPNHHSVGSRGRIAAQASF